MTEHQLHVFIKESFPCENEKCEWKAFSNLKHSVAGRKGEDVVSYVSAIANMEGGHLVMGIEDKSLLILGVSDVHDYTKENFASRILGNCTNLNSDGLELKEFVTSDTNKRVWVLSIPKHSPRRPVIAHQKAWQRKGDSLIQLIGDRELSILNEPLFKSDDWSAGICKDATIDDLDPNAIKKARENYKAKFPDKVDEIAGWDIVTFLNKAKILIRGNITRTAIILLGKPESEHYLSPSECKIRWILKDIGNVEKDYEIFTCPLLINAESVFLKIRNLKYRYIRDNTMFPEEVDQYEPYVIREALNNCIAHQDYSSAGRINVVEKDDELVFTNHGLFIPGKVENVIKENAPEELYRNPFLATAMFSLQMVDTIGSGIRKMFTYQRNRLFPMPEYDFSARKVKVTITGKVVDLNFARALTQNPDLSLEEIIILDKVQKHKVLYKEEVKLLKAKGLLEGKKPNYYISASLAQTVGLKATYTRSKAFDNQDYFDWIIQGVKDHGSLTRKDIEGLLWDKLSDLFNDSQKKVKINNLISLLRKKGKIINMGTDSRPNWMLKNN